MRRMFKYQCPAIGTPFAVKIKRGSVIRHFGLQGGQLFFWAEVEDEVDTEPRTFVVVGTGHPIIPMATMGGPHYIGTTVVPDDQGGFVWHLFEYAT